MFSLNKNRYYDDVLDEWVERCSTTEQIQRTPEQSSDEEDEQHVTSPTAKARRNAALDDQDLVNDHDYLSDISFDSLADNARTTPRRKRRTVLRISPFVLRSPIHFSMTPMKRPDLPIPQTAPNYAELDDLDHYQNNTQEQEDDEEEAHDEDREEEQLDGFEVNVAHISEVMGDSDTDADSYVASGSVSSNSVSSCKSARSRSSHTPVSVREESDTESQSGESLAEESTQGAEDWPGTDSDVYVSPSEQGNLSPVSRMRKRSTGLPHSRPISVRSGSKRPTPAPHVKQANGRNYGVFLDSGPDTTPRPQRFRITRFSHSLSPSTDKSPLRRHTKKNRCSQMSTDSDSCPDALPLPNQRNPTNVTAKKTKVSVAHVKVPRRRRNRKLFSDPSPNLDLDVLSDHMTEQELDHENGLFVESPHSSRNGRSRQLSAPSVIEIPDTDESEQSGENSADEYEPRPGQTNARKHITQSSSPMHKTLTASSLTRPRATFTASKSSSVPSKTASLISKASVPTPRAAIKPTRAPRRKKRTISTILDSDFSDSGDSEYTGSGNKTKRRPVKSPSNAKAQAIPLSRGRSRKRRSVSYGDEQSEEGQSDVDDDDDEVEFVHRRKKHVRSGRLS